VRFLPVDFGTDGIGAKLADARLDAAKPIVVSWLGVTQYLTLDAVDTRLRAVASWRGVARSHSPTSPTIGGRRTGRKGGDGGSAGACDKFRRTMAVEILRGQDRRPASMAGFSRVEPFTIENAARRNFEDRPDGLLPCQGIGLVSAKT
jgi:O-methyltransferase involved in polyketide biosynthesis